MKKTLFLLATIALYESAVAQSRFEFGINLYPNISSAIIIGEGFVHDVYRNIETSKLSYSAGPFVRMLLGRMWGASVGVNYINTGYATHKQDLSPGVPEPGPESIQYIYRKTALEVPLLLEWSFVNGAKWKLYASIGPSLWLNLADEVVEIRWYENGDKKKSVRADESAEFRKVNGALTAGLGLRGQLSPRLSFFVQPSYQIALQDMAQNTSFNRRLNNFGLATGLILK